MPRWAVSRKPNRDRAFFSASPAAAPTPSGRVTGIPLRDRRRQALLRLLIEADHIASRITKACCDFSGITTHRLNQLATLCEDTLDRRRDVVYPDVDQQAWLRRLSMRNPVAADLLGRIIEDERAPVAAHPPAKDALVELRRGLRVGRGSSMWQILPWPRVGIARSSQKPIARRDGITTAAASRPSQQRADARTGAPRQLLCGEAGVSPCAPARRPYRGASTAFVDTLASWLGHSPKPDSARALRPVRVAGRTSPRRRNWGGAGPVARSNPSLRRLPMSVVRVRRGRALRGLRRAGGCRPFCVARSSGRSGRNRSRSGGSRSG